MTVKQENAELLINVGKGGKKRIQGKVLPFYSIFPLNYSSHKSELIERERQTFGPELQKDNSLKSLIKSTWTEL